MPADQRCGLDDQKRGPGIKEARPENQPKPSRVDQPSRPNFVFLVECQLLAKKQVLGNQGSSRSEAQASETERFDRQLLKGAEYGPDQPEGDSSIQLSTGALRRLTTAILFGLKGLPSQDVDNFCGAHHRKNGLEHPARKGFPLT